MQQVKAATEAFQQKISGWLAEIQAARISLANFLERYLPKYYQDIDSILKLFNDEAPSPITCKKGCAGCCTPLVAISPLEAAYLWKGIADTRSAAEIKELISACEIREKKQQELKEQARDFNHHSELYMREKIPCQFLDADRSCTAHQNRPFACRNYNVVSEPAFCFDLDEIQKVKVWRHPVLWQIDLSFKKTVSQYFFGSDEMGSMQAMLLKYRSNNLI